MVGRDLCVVQTTGDTVITCIAPQRDEPVVENVTVSEQNTLFVLYYSFSGEIWSKHHQQCGSA